MFVMKAKYCTFSVIKCLFFFVFFFGGGGGGGGEDKKYYGSLPKSSNTVNIRTRKIIAKYNFKMFPKISNSG